MEFVLSSKYGSMHERGEVSRLGIRIRCIIESRNVCESGTVLLGECQSAIKDGFIARSVIDVVLHIGTFRGNFIMTVTS